MTPAPTLTPGDRRKGCCREMANLTRTVVRLDLVYDTCRVCGCKHWRLYADPVRVRLTLS